MFRILTRICVSLILSAQVSAGGASGKDFFAMRRQALMKRIEGSLAVLQGAADTRAYVRFRQNNDFYYLTGVEAPGAFLMVDACEHRSTLFVPPRNAQLELWEGPRLFAGQEARIATGVDEVLEVSKLQSELEKRKGTYKHLYTPFRAEEIASTSRDRAAQYDSAQEKNPWDGRISREKAFKDNLRKRLGDSLDIQDLSPILDGMRRVKDGQEIERLREAGRIAAQGMNEAMRATKPGLYEFQIAAVAEWAFKWNGAMGVGYFPIVGSGPNSCILHYHSNDRRMEEGDLVVMDFGPDYQYYHSDITRTFPVSGRFSQEQARVYQTVLDAQKAALAKVRPGVTFGDLNDAAREVVSRFGYARYWRHGVSHYVGMSTHDVGKAEAFEPGVVITIEPGLYLREKKLGVRIEDTVLVTKDGCEILSIGAPKEIVEIERFMADRSAWPGPNR